MELPRRASVEEQSGIAAEPALAYRVTGRNAEMAVRRNRWFHEHFDLVLLRDGVFLTVNWKYEFAKRISQTSLLVKVNLCSKFT